MRMLVQKPAGRTPVNTPDDWSGSKYPRPVGLSGAGTVQRDEMSEQKVRELIRVAVMLHRSLERLSLAIEGCAKIGFQESSPTTNAHHASIWNDLNEAQKDAKMKLEILRRPSGTGNSSQASVTRESASDRVEELDAQVAALLAKAEQQGFITTIPSSQSTTCGPGYDPLGHTVAGPFEPTVAGELPLAGAATAVGQLTCEYGQCKKEARINLCMEHWQEHLKAAAPAVGQLSALLAEWQSEIDEYDRLAEVARVRSDTIMKDRYLDMVEVGREWIKQANALLCSEAAKEPK